MAFLKNLPPNAVLLELFKSFPETSRPLLAYHEVLMRGPSPLSAADRELIAAFVSGLNACHYCHGVHEATARQFGVDEATMGTLLTDIDAAPIGARLKPLLGYVRKLTLEPSRMTPADAEAVFAAGWDDRALHDAVSVCALFNLMNRLVSGTGIDAGGEYFELAAKRLHDGGYGGLVKLLG
ncbi:MAG: peroxidase [Betaproteobacteria bacterium]|nr:MAG: peroxidase [Betaproteobacteria bacterium]